MNVRLFHLFPDLSDFKLIGIRCGFQFAGIHPPDTITGRILDLLLQRPFSIAVIIGQTLYLKCRRIASLFYLFRLGIHPQLNLLLLQCIPV